jgi:hypothetical protein
MKKYFSVIMFSWCLVSGIQNIYQFIIIKESNIFIWNFIMSILLISYCIYWIEEYLIYRKR